jgi:cell division protein FtsL
VTRLNLLLMAAVLLSGMYLVRTAYDSRRLFNELDRAQNDARRLEIDFQRLQAERHAQATNLRVEQVARERLKMRPITPAITQPAVDARGAASPDPASGGKP